MSLPLPSDARPGLPADESERCELSRSVVSTVSETAALIKDNRLEAVYSKISRRVLSLFVVVVVLNHIDRTNLAYAAPSMNRDLGFGPQTYGLGSSLFFLTFCLFQIPSNLVMVRVGVRKWLSVLLMGWGVAASCFALIYNAPTFFTLRLVLGVFEAGAVPAMWYHLSQFYPQERLTKPYMYLTVGILIAQIVGGPLAAGFLAMDGLRGLRGWQWLFMLEGIPSILMGIMIALALPDSPQSARWLSDIEKELLANDMAEHRKNSPPRDQIPKNMRKLLKVGFSNPVLLYLTFVGILQGCTSHTYILWLPTIIEALLHGRVLSSQAAEKPHPSNKTISLLPIILTCLPYLAGALAAGIVAASSQRRKEAYYHAALSMLSAGVFFVLFPVLAKVHIIAGFVCLVLIASAGSAAVPPKISLVAHASRGPSQVIGMPFYNSISVLGGFVGPFATGAIVQTSGGGFTVVAIVMGVIIFTCGLLVIALKFWEPYLLRCRGDTADTAWEQFSSGLPVVQKNSNSNDTYSEADIIKDADITTSVRVGGTAGHDGQLLTHIQDLLCTMGGFLGANRILQEAHSPLFLSIGK